MWFVKFSRRDGLFCRMFHSKSALEAAFKSLFKPILTLGPTFDLLVGSHSLLNTSHFQMLRTLLLAQFVLQVRTSYMLRLHHKVLGFQFTSTPGDHECTRSNSNSRFDFLNFLFVKAASAEYFTRYILNHSTMPHSLNSFNLGIQNQVYF